MPMSVDERRIHELHMEADASFREGLRIVFGVLWRDPALMAALRTQGEVEELLMAGKHGPAALMRETPDAFQQMTEAATLHIRAWLSLARTEACPHCLASILVLLNGATVDWPIADSHRCLPQGRNPQQAQHARKAAEPLPLG